MNKIIILIFVLLIAAYGIYDIVQSHKSLDSKRTFKAIEDSNPEDSLIADETYLTHDYYDSAVGTFIYTYNDIERAKLANSVDWLIVDDFYSESDSSKITWFQYSNHALPYDERTNNLFQ